MWLFYNCTWYVSSDFPKVSRLPTWSALAQRRIEGEPGCRSGAVQLTSWCILQSTLPCVHTSPALRTAARSTRPPPTWARLAGTDPLTSLSSALHLMDSTLERRRKGSPTSPALTRTPTSRSPVPATSGPQQRTAHFPLRIWTWGSATCPPLLWHTALSKDSGRREHCPRWECWSPLRLTPGWCERPRWRSTRTTPSGWCPGRSCRRSWSPGTTGISSRRVSRAPLHLTCLHLNRLVLNDPIVKLTIMLKYNICTIYLCTEFTLWSLIYWLV